MKHPSFRFRIALLSTVLAGIALLGFSAVAWRAIYSAKVSRLDARLESQVARLARLVSVAASTIQLNNLRRELDIGRRAGVAWQVRAANGQVISQSENWATLFDRPEQRRSPFSLQPLPNSDRQTNERSRVGSRRDDGRPSRRSPPPERRPRLLTQRTNQGLWRVAIVNRPDGQVAIAVSLRPIRREMTVIRNGFLIAIPGTLLLVAVGAWVLSGRALRPVRQLTGVMQQITVTGLDQRVPLGPTDAEFVELIQVFNGMLERLERSFLQASRFSADAAHELKTPLAILQGELERALQQAPPASPLQQTLSSLLDEVRRLSGIVRKLLLLSLADAGQIALNKVSLNLSELLMVMVEDLELLAPTLAVQAEIAPELRVQGDRDLLTQVLQNLMSNAVKYNLPNGWIRIQGWQEAAAVHIIITNASKVMSGEERDRIFDRFYRGDPARTRQVEGIGLGLSLSQEIVRAHGGSLVVTASSEAQTAFTLILPQGQFVSNAS